MSSGLSSIHTWVIHKSLLSSLLLHHCLLLHLPLVTHGLLSLRSLHVSLLKLSCHALIINLLLCHCALVAHLHADQVCDVICVALVLLIVPIVLLLVGLHGLAKVVRVRVLRVLHLQAHLEEHLLVSVRLLVQLHNDLNI